MEDPIFGKAFEKSPVGMALLDSKGMILAANPALCNTIEKDLPVLIGGYMDDHMNSEDGRKWRSFYSDFVKNTAQDYYFEAIFFPTRPREAWWSIQLGDLERLVNGERVFFGVIQDITLKKVNEFRLKEARINAERASRAKSQFLANMSHEIRTPLHTITGMTEVLLDSDLKEAQLDYAHQISLSADVLISLIDDVLDFSKIEAGRMVLDNAPFDLLKVMDQSLELVSLNAYKKGLELASYVESRVPHLLIGDSHRLRQIVVNLLSNAVKFTSRGEILLRCQLDSETGSQATLKISVKDTGIGLSEYVKENLFEAFYQGDSSTTRKFGGTGLGLAISQRLVKMMGGEISVESVLGEGAEFSFTFTLEKQANSNLYSSLGPEFFEKAQVLLVEDNLTVRRILTTYLEEWGCLVSFADSSSEAMEILRASQNRNKFSMAILEQSGPELDAWDLAARIRQDQRLDGVFLILMASYSKKLDLSRKKDDHVFQAFISKPVKRQELLEAVFRGVNKGALGFPPSTLLPLGMSKDAHLIEDGPQKTILVAEDNEVNRELFNLLLRKMGYRVLLASNGLEAVQLFATEDLALIFMDLQMPEMNGFEAASKIRKMGSKIPIVAVTASALKGEMERCLKAGMTDFITKPFKTPDLVEVIGRVFQAPTQSFIEASLLDRSLEEENGMSTEIDSNALFNLTEALQIFLGKKEILIKLIQNFIPKVEGHLANIRENLSHNHFEGIFKEAHAIKGSALNLTAVDLGNAAAALEKSSRENLLPESQDNFLLLERAFIRFRKVVAGLIAS